MKNIFLFILLVSVLVIGFGTFIFSMYQKEIRKAEVKRLEDLTTIIDTLANDLNYILTSTEKDLKLLASIYTDKEKPSTKNFSNIYNSIFKINSFLLGIFYIDSKGTMRAVAPYKYSKGIGNNYAFRKYFQEAKKKKTVFFSAVLDNYKAKDTEEDYKSIVVTLPIFDKNKEFSGVFGAELDLDKIQQRIQKESYTDSIGKRGFYCIDYKAGQIIARPDQKHITPIFDNVLLSTAGKIDFKGSEKNTFTFNRKKFFYSSKTIDNEKFSLLIVGVFPFKDSIFTLRGMYSQIRGIILIIGAVILIALFMIIYNEKILKKLKKRIKDLEINIDITKKEEATSSITESKYYKELIKKIDAIKKKGIK